MSIVQGGSRRAKRVMIKKIVKRDMLKLISGGKLSLGSNPIAEINLATMGLDTSSILALGRHMHWDLNSTAKAIGATTRTLERHRVDNKPLNIKVSENALEIARLSSIGIEYFGDIARFNEWLSTPNTQFDNKKPVTVIHTVRGRELIKRIIRGLEYGFTA
jgi:putative toxin-antitoxin system antitoxin component (TIGR02293 family)